jgi:hypothetical protein
MSKEEKQAFYAKFHQQEAEKRANRRAARSDANESRGAPDASAQPASGATPPSNQIRPDVQAAMGRMHLKFGGRMELRRLDQHLRPAEKVEEMTIGSYGGTGLVVLTDRRLLFFRGGLVGKNSEDFPRDKVSSVQFSSGLVLGKITLFASGNKAEIQKVNKADAKRVVGNMRARLSAPTPDAAQTAPPVPGMAAGDDLVEQIKKLAELRDAGAITAAGFEFMKAALISRL